MKEPQCWHRHACILYNSGRARARLTLGETAFALRRLRRRRPPYLPPVSLPTTLHPRRVATRIEVPLHDSRITSVTFRALVTWQLLNELPPPRRPARPPPTPPPSPGIRHARAPFSPEVICLQLGSSPLDPDAMRNAGDGGNSCGFERASSGVDSAGTGIFPVLHGYPSPRSGILFGYQSISQISRLFDITKKSESIVFAF